jgi:hypothetical protein
MVPPMVPPMAPGEEVVMGVAVLAREEPLRQLEFPEWAIRQGALTM